MERQAEIMASFQDLYSFFSVGPPSILKASSPAFLEKENYGVVEGGKNAMCFSSHDLFPLFQSWERYLALERILDVLIIMKSVRSLVFEKHIWISV